MHTFSLILVFPGFNTVHEWSGLFDPFLSIGVTLDCIYCLSSARKDCRESCFFNSSSFFFFSASDQRWIRSSFIEGILPWQTQLKKKKKKVEEKGKKLNYETMKEKKGDSSEIEWKEKESQEKAGGKLFRKKRKREKNRAKCEIESWL